VSPRTVAALAVVTVLTVAAAVWAAIERPSATPVETVDRPAFPDLRAQPDAVTAVVIESAERTIRLEREEPGGWITPERAGYPVASDKVRELVVALADMRLIEPKTAQPERFARLEVEDVDAEDAKSRLVRLEGAGGEVLAEAIFGKQRNRLTGVQPSGIYLRMPGDEQSWLASGGPEIESEVAAWLERSIIDLAGEEVARVELDPADAEPYAVARAADGEAFTIEDLGEDETIKEEPGFERLAGALAGLEHADVRPQDEIDWSGQTHRARFVTFDGLEVTVHGALLEQEDEEQAWARFEVATGDLGELAQDEAEQVQARADTIAERTEGWAYQIPQYILDRLSRPKSEWLAQPDETS